MPNKAIDALAFCPFYVREGKTSITCEGIVGSFTVNKFKSELSKERHEKNFCTAKTCCGCGVFSALMENYQDRPPVQIRH